jgi:hypothetical protein
MNMTNEEKAIALINFAASLEGEGFTYSIVCGHVDEKINLSFGLYGYTEDAIALLRYAMSEDENFNDIVLAAVPLTPICEN